MNENGEILWADQPGDDSTDRISDLAITSEGNLIVSFDGLNFDGGSDYSKLIKYDVDGNREILDEIFNEGFNETTGKWAEKDERWSHVSTDNEGNFYAGSSGRDESLDGQALDPGVFIDSNRFRRFTKYDITGTEIWTTLVPTQTRNINTGTGFYYSGGGNITTDKDGNLFTVIRKREYQLNNDGSFSFTNLIIQDGVQINKYDSQTGDIIGEWFIEETSYSVSTKIATDSENNIYLTGSNSITKFNDEGEKLWEKSFNELYAGKLKSITIDNNNDIYISGDLGFSDDMVWLIKYSPSGSVIWAKHFTSNQSYDSLPNNPNSFYQELTIRAKGVAVTPNGKIYATGEIWHERYHDPTGTTSTDTWINKLVPFNNQPILDATFSPSLTSTIKDNISQGQTVAEIIVDGSITELDVELREAMAITQVDNSNGIWEYSLDGGNTWYEIDNINNSNGLLLAPDNLIRFNPISGYHGDASFNFRAWDQGDFTDEFQVHSFMGRDQENSAIAAQSNGGYVIVWQSNNPELTGTVIYGQRYDYSGSRLGEEFQISTNLQNPSAKNPAITLLSDDGFIVIWETETAEGTYILGKRYDKYGFSVGEEINFSGASSDSYSPSLTTLSNGDVIVKWLSYGNSIAEFYGVNLNDLDSIFKIGETEIAADSSITDLNDEKFLASWVFEGRNIQANELYTQIVEFDGTKVGNQILVTDDILIEFNDNSHSIVSLTDGQFLVTWVSGQTNTIYAQRYDLNGEKVGEQLLVTENGKNPSSTTLFDGSFIITWEQNTDTISTTGIYGQRYDTNGNKIEEEFKINSYQANSYTNQQVVTLENGHFISIYDSLGQDRSRFGVYGKRFVPSGSIVSIEDGLHTSISDTEDIATITVYDEAYDQLFTTEENQPSQGNFITTQDLSEFQLKILDGDFNEFINGDTSINLNRQSVWRL